eukprot:15539-Heterococcus_DN1.PRE.3
MKKVLSPSSETKTSENACTKPLRVASRVLAASERDRGTSATAAAAGRAWLSSAISAIQAAAAVLPPSLRASALSKLCAENGKQCVKSADCARTASKASLRNASERCWNGESADPPARIATEGAKLCTQVLASSASKTDSANLLQVPIALDLRETAIVVKRPFSRYCQCPFSRRYGKLPQVPAAAKTCCAAG